MNERDFKRLRSRLGFTQSQFARVLGVHPLTVSRWERGQVAPDGPTALLLETMDKRTRDQKPPPTLADDVLKALAVGAAVAGLVCLLAILFGGKR